MKKLLKILNKFVFKKRIIALIALIFLFGLIIIFMPKQNTTKEQAIVIVKNLPEVKSFLKILDKSKGGFILNAENRENNYWLVQVSEVVVDSKIDGKYMSHMVTFNWYLVDKNSGSIKCSFYVYDKNGKQLNKVDAGCR